MQWQELADLPFAAMLEPHDGALSLDGSYDTAHFDHLWRTGYGQRAKRLPGVTRPVS
jgi:hypothetical protein